MSEHLGCSSGSNMYSQKTYTNGRQSFGTEYRSTFGELYDTADKWHVQYALLRPPRELMCKIWLESIRPLRICACVKNKILRFFINISIYLSKNQDGGGRHLETSQKS